MEEEDLQDYYDGEEDALLLAMALMCRPSSPGSDR